MAKTHIQDLNTREVSVKSLCPSSHTAGAFLLPKSQQDSQTKHQPGHMICQVLVLPDIPAYSLPPKHSQR